MSCKISKSKIKGTIICPANKSYTHRAIFMATLADGKSEITNALRSADTNATIDTCVQFGAEITDKGSNLIIESNSKIKSIDVDVKNSGTTIRIATAIAALSDAQSKLTGDASIQNRPMGPLLDALESMGVQCTSQNQKPPITVSGLATGGEVSVPGDISSQFASAIMIIAPRTTRGITLNIQGELVSKPYLDATIATMNEFGVKVQTVTHYKKYIISPQRYTANNFVIPSDFSSFAILLSAAILIGDNIAIKMVPGDLPQGDAFFLGILQGMGVKINSKEDLTYIDAPEKLNGGTVNLGNTPDLLPPFAILVLKSKSPIEITGVKHARYKETDRIAILCRELKKLGVIVEEKEDGMILTPPEKLSSATLNAEKDHRLFMVFCIAAMYIGNCTVTDPESVAVSYPDFIQAIKDVGGKIETC